jgi:N-acyl-phosphatidylethanolamine-hydrolysing phospholipase D
MPSRHRYHNQHFIAPHSVWDVFRWKFRLRPPETSGPDVEVDQFQPEVQASNLALVRQPNPDCLQLTWIGHSSFLVQHQGWNILLDPIFGEHCSPVPLPSLRRLRPPGLPFEALPPIHAVAISHSHYDHLDRSTVRRLGNTPKYWVPAGLGAWFAKQGFHQVREFNWWASEKVSPDLELTCVPAHHFSARTPFDRDQTLWCGWVLRSGKRSLYFAGDSAYCPIFKDIGSRLGPFDLAILPIGAYNPRWVMQSIHMDPAEAVSAHFDLGAKQSVACHWGTFRLTDEPLGEPPVRLRRETARRGLPVGQFRTMALGETLTV